MSLMSFFRRRPFERPGYLLYGEAVRAARDPWWYLEGLVPDTLEGRFDMVSVFASLLIDRLGRETEADAAALSQAVFDAMFSDMDVNLREMGVGDLGVLKRVKTMWEAFHGRALAYRAGMDDPDDAALIGALERNIWRDAASNAPALAAAMRRNRAHLAAQPLATLKAGQVGFLPVEQAIAA